MANSEKVHIRHALLFLFDSMKSGQIRAVNEAKIAAEWLNTTYGGGTVSETTCRRWFARFRSGNRCLEDLPREGAPSVIDDAELDRLLEENDELKAEELAAIFNCTVKTVYNHLEASGRVSKLSHWVPSKLTSEQKHRRVEVCTDLLQRYESGQLHLEDIVTCDETWVLYDNPGRRRYWVKKGQAPPPTPKPGPYPKKVQLSIWWCARGVLFWDLRPKGETINAEVYCDYLEKMSHQLRYGPLKEPGAHTRKKRYFLLQDGATPHTARMTKEKIAALNLELLPHAAKSADKAPTDFHVNRSLKNFLRGRTFETEKEIREVLEEFFKTKFTPAFCTKGMMKLPDRWQEIIDSGGCYIDD